MNPYTEKLKLALARYEAQCGISPEDSILEAMWYVYSCCNPVDDGRIKAAEKAISAVYAELSIASSDALSDLIVSLLESYQRAAYLEGLRTGVHLMEETA